MEYKVESFYQWFKELNYIEFLKDINELEDKIEKLKNIKVEYSDKFKKEFDKLIHIVNNLKD